MRGAGWQDAEGERQGTTFETYEYYDSPIETYEEHFHTLIVPHRTIADFVTATYAEKIGSLVGIELGGPARRLFRGFPQGCFKNTAGFTLTDQRTSEERRDDSARGHEVIEADVFFKSGPDGNSFKAVQEWIKDHGGADIIIERMVGPLDMIRDASIFQALLTRWYPLAGARGTLLLQVPRTIPLDQLKPMCNWIEQRGRVDGFEARFDLDDPYRKSVLIRRKA